MAYIGIAAASLPVHRLHRRSAGEYRWDGSKCLNRQLFMGSDSGQGARSDTTGGKMIRSLACVAAVAFAIPVAAFAEQPKAANGMLVDENGMTLYTFDADAQAADGASACTGQCATIWPAAKADDNDRGHGDWTLVKTADGQQQWAYKGHRLYRFSKDAKPGDMNGDGFKGVWHMAQP
jgi:predicted lipoprotein with Yx(FWY)xxD motif